MGVLGEGLDRVRTRPSILNMQYVGPRSCWFNIILMEGHSTVRWYVSGTTWAPFRG